MYKVQLALALIFTLAACSGADKAAIQDDSAILATAFGKNVTLLQIERELRNMNPEQRDKLISTEEEFKKLVGVMLFQQKMLDVAQAEGLMTDEFRFTLERDRQRYIARRLASDKYESAEILDLEADALKYYADNPEQFTPTPRIHVAHIQLNAPTPEEKARRLPEAEKLLKQLRDGADFGRLATDHSEDFGRYSAGDIGFIKKGDMVDEFWDAISALEEPGQLSDVVETRTGLHIIRLIEKGPVNKTPFEQAKEAIMQRLEEEQRKKAVEDWVVSVAPPADVDIKKDVLDGWWKKRYAALRTDQAN